MTFFSLHPLETAKISSYHFNSYHFKSCRRTVFTDPIKRFIASCPSLLQGVLAAFLVLLYTVPVRPATLAGGFQEYQIVGAEDSDLRHAGKRL
ncbi:MAG: hypothetical protein GKR94_01750 [Gammaproteobacteria bacterium]|nr:hypothetical protein [Gammaproteobacteria bacterium]